jgi:hypothetical protein
MSRTAQEASVAQPAPSAGIARNASPKGGRPFSVGIGAKRLTTPPQLSREAAGKRDRWLVGGRT